MKTLAIILFISFSTFARAGSVDNKIRHYIDEIDKTQKNIAGLLVLQNFSRFMVNTVQSDEVDLYFDHYQKTDSAHSLHEQSQKFFNMVFSDEAESDKIASATQFLILLRRSKHNWVDLGARIKRSHENFYKVFKTQSSICSDQNFYESMAVLENFTPQGVDTSKLRQAWNLKVGSSARVNDEGETSFGTYADIEAPNDKSEDARHAVATTAGALALYAPPPWNIAGAIGLPILIEVTWGIVDMNKNIRKMDKIALANHELFQSMSYEINVKKHFNLYCNELERAYLEVRPLVLNHNRPEGYALLEKAWASSKNVPNIDPALFFQTPDTFYAFAKFKALNDAMTIFGHNDQYFKNWQFVLENIDEFTNNIEMALSQIIAHKRYQTYVPDTSVFTDIFEQIENLNNLKKTYSRQLLDYFDLQSKDEKRQAIQHLRKLVEHYRLLHTNLTTEEDEVLDSYENLIHKLERRNV
jgi:hypothetical protein